MERGTKEKESFLLGPDVARVGSVWFELVWGREGLKWWCLKTGLEVVAGGREKGLVWRSWTVVSIRVWCRRDGLVIHVESEGLEQVFL